jgi:glycosyltransferase involved in cell wall biosynthesis
MLLEVLARQRWRDRPLHVDIYGGGLHRQSIAEMAARLGLDNVTVHGFAADVESVLREHHGIVLASRTEGMPLVVHEAMACGRVPIVTDAGGTAELVEDGVNGFVASDPGPNALDDALERAWQSRAEWPQIAGRAAERLASLVAARPASPLADIALGLIRA